MKFRFLPLLLACLLQAPRIDAAFVTRPASIDPVTLVNQLRTTQCPRPARRLAPLIDTAGLRRAAQRWSMGGRLEGALDAVGYRARHAAGIELSGVRSGTQLQTLLLQNYCAQLTDATATEIGFYQQGMQLWLVLATPHLQPAIDDQASLQAQVLGLTNNARANGRRCGDQWFAAVGPLAASRELNVAATVQANDMARRKFLEHRGSDGSSPSDRVTRTGYAWKTVGENIALGPESAAEVVNGWLASPGHCENIMDGRFTVMGLAVVSSTGAKPELYWSQVFARPQGSGKP
ncbi:MAG: CAP domain-containing protein [Steroidobacteraceae bacterium]